MLDTGHLMHMNLELKTQDEAVDYILEKLQSMEIWLLISKACI